MEGEQRQESHHEINSENPWATVVSDEFHAAMARSTGNPGQDHLARGSKWVIWCPRQDSNLRTRLRRALLCNALTWPDVLVEVSLGRVWGAGNPPGSLP
jgi:hypothetical protein